MRFGEEDMRSQDYFRRLAETPRTEEKKNLDNLEEQIEKFFAAGKTVTQVPVGASRAVLSPMGICSNSVRKRAQK